MTRTRVRGPAVGWLLLGVSGLILVLPLAAILALRIYQTHLVRQTENSLIAQSVVIGELYRDALLAEMGREPASDEEALPPRMKDERYAPITPTLDLARGVHPPLKDPAAHARIRTGPRWAAGRRIAGDLSRAQLFNLSSVHVLDPDGCIVAASGSWLGRCVPDVPEVQDALSGQYSSIARRRVSDSPTPPMESISRRGDVRVFTATPIFQDGQVMAVVWASRTSMAPAKAAWLYRKPLLFALAGVLALAALMSLFLARSITGPLGKITRAAESVSRGGSPEGLTPQGFAPREVHVLGEALSAMNRQLSGRAEYISEFAANVSHELKSPITAIRGAAELLQEEFEKMEPRQRQRFLSNIQSDASRMERLVSRLLELARIQSAPETAQDVHLPEFLARVTEPYGDRVRLEVRDVPAVVSMNPDHLESALKNLLDNGIRHGGEEPVELVATGEDGRAVFSVVDHGEGIDRKNMERIFDRFFTTVRDRGGTGLGLAIVQAVARTRGTEVEVRTGPRGSTFTLTV